MSTAFNLLNRVVQGRLPPRILYWGLLNTVNRWLKTGNKRFEFERAYLETPDPWSYRSSPYEQAKYQRTMETIVAYRGASGSALECGCSVGVFSKMLSQRFDKVVSLDVSGEALNQAVEFGNTATNIRFIRGDIKTTVLGGPYDLIVCAEMLYYLLPRHAEGVCARLEQLLSPDGILVLVFGLPAENADEFYSDGWDALLGEHFKPIHQDVVMDPFRPYQISVYSARGSPD